MKIVYCGHGDPGYQCLDQILNSEFEVVLVLTHPDIVEDNSGYHSKSVFNLAVMKEIPVKVFSKISKAKIHSLISLSSPDLLVSVNWRGIFTKDILKIPALGAINLHGSLLPRWRGNSPVTWAMINGDTNVGATIHYMDEFMDSGDILDQFCIPILCSDDISSLKKKMSIKEAGMLMDVLYKISNNKVIKKSQDSDKVTIGKKRWPEDGLIDWNWKASEIYDWIRSMTNPLPGAFTYFNGRKVIIWKASYINRYETLEDPGTIVAYKIGTSGACPELIVSTGGGVIVLENMSFYNIGENINILKSEVFEIGMCFDDD